MNEDTVDVSGSDGAGEALPPPLPAAPPRRFCGECGAPWHPEWERCPACAPGAPVVTGHAHAVASARAAAHDAERRSLTSAIVLYFALLAVSLVGFIAGVAGADELSIDFFGTGGMTLVTVAWAALLARPALRMLFRPAGAKWVLLGAGAGFVTFALAYAVIESLVHAFGFESIKMTAPYLAGGYGTGTVVLMICVQPALIEELAFRGIVFDALRPTLSTAEAVFVSAGMFMILHLAPGAFPHTFAMGVVAGFLRARTESLLPGVLLHFVHNLLCVVTEYSPMG